MVSNTPPYSPQAATRTQIHHPHAAMSTPPYGPFHDKVDATPQPSHCDEENTQIATMCTSWSY